MKKKASYVPQITEEQKQLAIKARDAREHYDNMHTLFLAGKISLQEITELHKKAEAADRALRQSVKKGAYRDIEKDLRNKYKK